MQATLHQELYIELIIGVTDTTTIDLNRIYTDDILDFIDSKLLDESGYPVNSYDTCTLDQYLSTCTLEPGEWVVEAAIEKPVEIEYTDTDYGERYSGEIKQIPDKVDLLLKLQATEPFGKYIIDIETLRLEYSGNIDYHDDGF